MDVGGGLWVAVIPSSHYLEAYPSWEAEIHTKHFSPRIPASFTFTLHYLLNYVGSSSTTRAGGVFVSGEGGKHLGSYAYVDFVFVLARSRTGKGAPASG